MRSEDPEDYHRLRHDEAPIEVWRELIANYSLANDRVALNKTVPVEILREIAADTRVLVRTHVAMVRRITEDIQDVLSRDPDSSVRNMLANNSKVTERILKLLSVDKEEFVRESAQRQIQKRKKQNNPHMATPRNPYD